MNKGLLVVLSGPSGSGKDTVLKGVLEKFENRITKYDKRSRKATFEITICNEKKEVQLSIELDGEEKEQEVSE